MKNKSDCWERLLRQVEEKGGDGESFVREVKELYRGFDPAVAEWLGGLYDPVSGGFYYSNSGRDNEGFGADVESTHQAVALLTGTGFINSADELPYEVKEGIKRFVCSLQEAEDGYFYHPQWDRNMPDWKLRDSRLGRDQNWSVSLANQLDFSLPYLTASERLLLSGDFGSAGRPAHLSSAEGLLEYLRGFDWDNNAYFAGSTLSSIGNQILSAGLADTAVEFMNSLQNKENGLWGKKGGYHATNALLKIAHFYSTVYAPIPNAALAARTAVDMICADMDPAAATVCWQYNVWFALYLLIDNLRHSGGAEGNRQADSIISEVLGRGAECVRRTREKVEIFKKPDGSYSYLQNRTSPTSQGAPVALENTDEGDVNATVICIKQTTESLFWALEMDMPPIFDGEDYKRFLSALKISNGR